MASRIARASGEGRLSAAAADNLSQWLSGDAYRDYHAVLERAVLEERFEELEAAFWEILPFGTGGRRGRMADFGTATLNPRTVAESAMGIARYMQNVRGTAVGRAVVAHDTRLRSKEFARLTAATFAACGLQVFLFDGPRATPELSFAVRRLKCDVGVMLTASHNPPSDNGIKAYWSDGGQVLPPHDAGIIDEVSRVTEIPVLGFEEAVHAGRVTMLGPELDDAYVGAVAALSLSDARDVRILYSPLHGVGESSVARVLRHAGFQHVEMFKPQSSPDGRFPNVPHGIANPEVPAVFDLALEYAKERAFDLVLASDPDADRIGAVVRDRDGTFVRLSGNRIGALITDFAIRGLQRRQDLTPEHYIVQTLVTTPLIVSIARSFGLRAVDDLPVGCKYIAEAIDKFGPARFVIGCEESHGYLAGDQARDKDAAVGALYLAEAAAEQKRNGRTLIDRLNELHCRHGYVSELQFSQTAQGTLGREATARLVAAFQSAPPLTLAGVTLHQVRDYACHEIRSLPENSRTGALDHPRTTMLIFEGTKGQTRFTFAVRPSGTEPKIKFYLFAITPPLTASALHGTEADTDFQLVEFRNALQSWMTSVSD